MPFFNEPKAGESDKPPTAFIKDKKAITIAMITHISASVKGILWISLRWRTSVG